MDTLTLKAAARKTKGSARSRQLRREGQTPAVLYGHQEEVVALSVNTDAITKVIAEGHHLVQIDVDGQPQRAIVKDVQFDAWGRELLHVDFTRVGLHEKVTVSVTIVSHGQPKAVLAGGVLEQPLHAVEVECEADHIPDQVVVEIGHLDMGDSIHVRDLEFPEGVEAASDPDVLVFMVHEPRGAEEVEETEPVEEAGTAEPEVISRGAKAEEEGADESAGS